MDYLEISYWGNFSVWHQLLYYIYSILSYCGNKSWWISITIAIVLNQKLTIVLTVKIWSFDKHMMEHWPELGDLSLRSLTNKTFFILDKFYRRNKFQSGLKNESIMILVFDCRNRSWRIIGKWAKLKNS